MQNEEHVNKPDKIINLVNVNFYNLINLDD